MIIDRLIELLPFPDNLVELGKGKDWGRITALFGNPLPADYMAFIDNYGSGEIGGWLTVLNPFSENINISLVEQFFVLLSSISTLKNEFPRVFKILCHLKSANALRLLAADPDRRTCSFGAEPTTRISSSMLS